MTHAMENKKHLIKAIKLVFLSFVRVGMCVWQRFSMNGLDDLRSLTRSSGKIQLEPAMRPAAVICLLSYETSSYLKQ